MAIAAISGILADTLPRQPECLFKLNAALLALPVILWMTIAVAGLARAQTAPTSAKSQEEKLEQDFTDPLSTLPQLLVRDSFSPANYGTKLETNQLIIRPLIPRIPPRSFLPFAQLIRPSFALVTVPGSRGGSRTEFG
ncbi:MAG TPA: hypothetical protein VGH29_20645, partial [Candidatus Binataceae bacterium]